MLSANLLWLPIANRIERISELEAAQMELAVEGILAIQAGANPRLVAQKLKALLPPGTVAASEAGDEQRPERAASGRTRSTRRRSTRTTSGGSSYADMITLLMVLFIVLFAISQVDQTKFAQLKTGLADGFGAIRRCRSREEPDCSTPPAALNPTNRELTPRPRPST